MPTDNQALPATNVSAAARAVTYSGDAVKLPVVALATVAGSDDAKTVSDVSSSNGLPVTLASLLSGENQQFNRMMGGAVVKYASVTADTLIVTGPAILYGIVLIAAGTMASIYDNTAASGTVLIPSSTASANFGGVGVLCNNGIYADWTSGTWLVLYVDAA